MPQNIFITGVPKVGKTTLLRSLATDLSNMGLKVGGFISPDGKESGARTAFFTKDLRSGKKVILADVKGDGPKVSKYHVNIKSFESVCIPALTDFDSCDVVIIDEIGTMECKSKKFLELLDKILESKVPLIASLHNDLSDKYSINGETFYLTDDNRNELCEELFEKVKAMKELTKQKIEKPKAQIKQKTEIKQVKSKKKQAKEQKPKQTEEHAQEHHEDKKGKGLLAKIRELLGV